MVNVLKSRYKTVDKAEQSMGITYDGEADKYDDIDENSVGDLLSKAKCLSSSDLSELCESLFEEMLIRNKVPMPGRDYIPLSLLAMTRLAQRQKSNVLYKLAKVIAVNKPNSTEPLMPMNRMPWGLIQYQIDFFACTHINEVTRFFRQFNFQENSFMMILLGYEDKIHKTIFLIFFIYCCYEFGAGILQRQINF